MDDTALFDLRCRVLDLELELDAIKLLLIEMEEKQCATA
jgi:hypothetical protein